MSETTHTDLGQTEFKYISYWYNGQIQKPYALYIIRRLFNLTDVIKALKKDPRPNTKKKIKKIPR